MDQKTKVKDISLKKYLLIGLALSLLLFLIDARISLGVAEGMFYVSLVILAFMTGKPLLVVYAAVLASLLNALSFMVSLPGDGLNSVIANRFLSIFAIWMSAIVFLLMNRAEERQRFSDNKLEEKIKDRTSKFKKTNDLLNAEIEHSKLIKTIAVASNETGAVDETLRFCIRKVCEFAEWPLGHLYFAAENPSD